MNIKAARQFLPLTSKFNYIPIVIYAANGDNEIEKAFSRDESGCIEKYIDSVLIENATFVNDADMILAYVWNQDNIPNCDIWKINQNHLSDDSGFLYDVRIYKNLDCVTDIGVASGDSLILLAAEEILLRELILTKGLSFKEATDRIKYQVKMPTGNNPKENFYN